MKIIKQIEAESCEHYGKLVEGLCVLQSCYTVVAMTREGKP